MQSVVFQQLPSDMGTSLTYTVNNPVQNGTLWYIAVRDVFLAGDDCPRLEFLANFAR